MDSSADDLPGGDPSGGFLGGPDSEHHRALRRRLLERVADADRSHLNIDAHQGEWQPLAEGVTVKVLHARDGVLSYLMRLAPGARLRAHRHRLDEECVVLEGRLQLGSHYSVGPGGWHLAHAGALHATVEAPDGALVFLRGAVPDAGDVLG